MKSYCLITLAACLVLSACNKENENPHSIELTWTECASTKAGGTKGGTSADTPAQLILEYTESGLAVTLKNAEMNCAINVDGLSLDLSQEGNIINYQVVQSVTANCTCKIERITSTVTGLEYGKEYVLNYSIKYVPSLKPIKFRFMKGLKMRLNVADYLDAMHTMHT